MKEAKALIEKYKAGTCRPEELRLIDKWLLEIHMGERSDLSTEDFEQIGKEVWNGVLADRTNSLGSLSSRARTARLWPRFAAVSGAWKVASRKKFATSLAAAAAVAVMTLGVWLYYASAPRHSDAGQNPGLAMNDILPGRNTATITFDDGEAVALNEEELDISSATVEPLKEGSEVAPETLQFLASRIAKSKIVVLSTPRGGTYKVVLPDGTRVWLNADSKISFPSQFSGRVRKVLLLSGEAYFEVAKTYVTLSPPVTLSPSKSGLKSKGEDRSFDKLRMTKVRQSFIVESAGQRVEVLGTHFNINSYADEGSTRTTLLEGSVNVNGRTLIPNQQAVLTATQAIQVKQVDPAEAIDWKNGEFVFDQEPLVSIMRKVARWYNVEVSYEDETVKQATFSGSVSRYEQVSKVLRRLDQTGEVKFRIEGRKIIVAK